LSCCRSTPARAADAQHERGHRQQHREQDRRARGVREHVEQRAAPAIPAGYDLPSTAASSIGPGRSAGRDGTMPSIAAAVSQTTGRQRRLGGRPSGNSRNSSVGVPNSAGSCTQVVSHAATAPPGSEPGAVTSA
jgi:hypothetical protein